MADATASPLPLTPVSPAERNTTIDVIRGFALFGILVVNIELFAYPIQRLVFPVDSQLPPLDRFIDWIVRFLAEGKFYTLFSFLFGLGFGLQLLRAEERGIKILPLYLRRLAILFLLGLVHLLSIWVGDILTFYAVAGCILLLFRKAKPRTLVIWAVVFLALPTAMNTLGTLAVVGGRMAGPQIAAQIDQSFAVQDSAFRADEARAMDVYAHGTFSETTEQRIRDASFIIFGYLAMGPQILGMFLVGLYFARRRVFADIDGHARLFRCFLIWGVPLGIVGNAVYATVIQEVPRIQPSGQLLLAMTGYAVGAPAFCLAYIGAVTLLLRTSFRQKMLSPLASAGQIPLSNYLAQSIICTFIFYGYGLGFFGRTGRLEEMILVIVLYGILVGLSTWWTSQWRYGPAEWVWRRGTYLKPF